MSAENRRRPVGVNDNQLPDETADATAAPDDCREDLSAMPEIGSLGFAAQFLVWVVRNWVGAFKTNQDFALVTENAFERFGLAGSAAAIDAAMTIVAASASRSIDIRCIKCRFLSPDEAILIDAVAAIQADIHFTAYSGLNKLMPMAAVRAALPHLVNLARDFAEARLRPQPIPRSGFEPAALGGDDAFHAPGNRYLH
jgi:hypothetical protein